MQFESLIVLWQPVYHAWADCRKINIESFEKPKLGIYFNIARWTTMRVEVSIIHSARTRPRTGDIIDLLLLTLKYFEIRIKLYLA